MARSRGGRSNIRDYPGACPDRSDSFVHRVVSDMHAAVDRVPLFLVGDYGKQFQTTEIRFNSLSVIRPRLIPPRILLTARR